MAEPLFAVKEVDFSYLRGTPALCGLTVDFMAGERTAVIGANGSGKSTLLSLLDGLIFPERGELHFRNTPLTRHTMNDAAFQREFRTAVGYVFQNPDVMLFCPTVREDILFGPLQFGVPLPEIERRFERVVNLLRLGPLLDRSPHHLSLGEKKKAAIAAVLICEPAVLLLDEPTAGLDPQTMRDIIDVLQEAHAAGKTVIMATHDLHIVEEIADTVHVFGSERRVIRTGSAEEVLGDHEFLQHNNLVHIHVHRHLHLHEGHVHEH